MKTKFGLAVGLNVAVACLVMQGCKATRVTGNNYGNEVKSVNPAPTLVAPADDINVADTPSPAPVQLAPAPAPVPAPVAIETAPAVVPAPSAKPKAKPASDTAAGPEYTTYKVKPGDMLSKISKRYNIRQKAILDMNPGLSPNKLYAGRTIKLPGKVDAVDSAAAPAPLAAPAAADQAAASATAASVKAPKAAKAAKYTGATKTYVVKGGDSLSKIAQENGTNVRTLKELNGLKNDRVFVGKKLKVPSEKAGDKAAEPAKKAAAPKAAPSGKDAVKPAPAKAADAAAPVAPVAPAEKPAEASSAAPEPVKDDTAASTATAAPEPEQQPAPSAATLDTHTVKEGEDVVSIAISYGVSPSALMDANDLKSSEVNPGDILKIPAKNAQ